VSDNQTQDISDKLGARTENKWYVAFQQDAQRARTYEAPYVALKAERNPRSYLISKARDSA